MLTLATQGFYWFLGVVFGLCVLAVFMLLVAVGIRTFMEWDYKRHNKGG